MAMIPGAFEIRPAAAPARAISALAARVTRVLGPALSTDRERLEREREGGGAPSERIGVGHRSMVGRLLDLLVGRNR